MAKEVCVYVSGFENSKTAYHYYYYDFVQKTMQNWMKWDFIWCFCREYCGNEHFVTIIICVSVKVSRYPKPNIIIFSSIQFVSDTHTHTHYSEEE